MPYNERLETFAREVIPTVLTGVWHWRPNHFVGPFKYGWNNDKGLLDHVACFKMDGRNRTYAYLSEPYDNPNLPTEPVIDTFWPLYKKPIFLAIVPLGKEFSVWNPGSTLAFILATPDLLLEPIEADAVDR